MNGMFKSSTLPLILILLASLASGLVVFRDYGLSWDEPLFYDYADAIPYAYSITARLHGNFDLEQAYGPSPGDHKNRGPAYLLIAGPVARGFEFLGLDRASAWHLTNFLAFQIGIIFFYLLCLRWVERWAAAAATLFLILQPIIWGHAFINPKDPSFAVFFLASMYLGLRLVDRLERPGSPGTGKIIAWTILPGMVLGLATSVRIIAPLAATLVVIYLLVRVRPNRWWAVIPYGLVALLTTYATWPYLWGMPIKHFASTLFFMSDNPTHIPVLFLGQVWTAGEVPRRFLLYMLALTLTEPTWLLVLAGLVFAVLHRRKLNLPALAVILATPLIVVAYVLLRQPALYDNGRHFIFLLPLIFVLVALGFQWMFDLIRPVTFRVLLTILLLLPGLINIVELHPYEYAYFNSFIGGTGGAFRQYETEYWLTCYKEAIQRINEIAPAGQIVQVPRESGLAAYYASPKIVVEDGVQKPGDWILFSTRTNKDRVSIFRNAPLLFTISREGADFCVARKIP
jgi:hypothetical protein